MESPHLTEIRRLPELRKARLTWSDGHTAEFDYDYLRGYCPCAGCQGHAVGPVVFHQPQVSVEPETIAPVGNYAIAFAWTDGHATGIYRFDFLRQICPCDACERERAATRDGSDGPAGEDAHEETP